jgi:hypothetical protein
MSVHAWPGGRGVAFLCRLAVAGPSVAGPSVGDRAAATVGVRLRR